MQLNYDGKLLIAIGRSRKATQWQNKEMMWSELVVRLSTTTRTRETAAEYAQLSKGDRDSIKDVGGFVGGYLKNGKRNNASVVNRCLVCLDADNADPELLDDLDLTFPNAYAVYSTHSHTTEKMRLRIIIPLARAVTPDEYAAISRRLADNLTLTRFDPTTFEAARLMYWPSTPEDGEYLFQHSDAPFVDPDAVLATYVDWRDASLWPTTQPVEERMRRTVGKHQYQRYCVEFLEEKPQCALFLDCGLGKTIITLTAISHLLYDSFEVSRVLIIAPLRVARDTWIAELAKWEHLKGLRMERVIGTPKERVAALSRKAELYIINRENVEWLVKHYAGRRLPFDMLVIDELSSFKNSHAKRFLALKKVLSQFSRVVGLTGTPAPNGLEDLWPQVFLLDRGVRLGRTMKSYLDMFFDTPNSWLPYKHELKPGAEEEIYRRLGDICVSMRAADHLQMPERVDNVVELTLSTKEERLYRQMERDMLLPYADGDVLALNAASLAGKLLQLSNGAVYDEFHNIRVIHDRKLDALEDLIEATNGKPVLVMYAYQHDLTRIQQRFGRYSPDNPVGVRELKTAEDMADWNAGRIAIAVTQPASTGHGLNLQHGGSTIVWFGLNWSLELYEQANARLWRQGQKETVVIHHLVVRGTMDEQVMQALHDKAADQNALLAAVKARIQNTVADKTESEG